MRKISGLIGALTLMLAMTSCGGGSTAPGGGGGGGGGGGNNCPAGTFCMGSSTFFTTTASTQPVTLTVNANTAVTWTNDSGIQHDVVFDDQTTALAVGNGSSGNIGINSSGSNQRQFAATGAHPFYCTIHGTATTGMRGVVNVQ